MSIDIDAIARQFRLQESQVRSTIELLDEGNTVPFITRYRKDLTGGLDEEKIRQIQDAVTRRRQLNERKERVLRSIQAQNQLTPELAERIEAASSLKTLDDLYLPFRPKKQTLATVARQRGLEPLALEILQAAPGNEVDLDARCAPAIDPEKELKSAAEVLAGARHILAELISERVDLRAAVRRALGNGELVSKRIERGADEDVDDLPVEEDYHGEESPHEDDFHHDAYGDVAGGPGDGAAVPQRGVVDEHVAPGAPEAVSVATEDDNLAPEHELPEHDEITAADELGEDELAADELTADELAADEPTVDADQDALSLAVDQPQGEEPRTAAAETQVGLDATQADAPVDPEASAAADAAKAASASAQIRVAAKAQQVATVLAAKRAAAEERRAQRREARHRKRQKLEQSFKDYFDYTEPLKKLPHYRVLAVNRGERCKVLRVRIQFDPVPLKAEVEAMIIAEGHPHAELLREVIQDALTRLVVPSIEREIRRELTERAESHAVKVFAQNLRKLLLQAPLRGRRVLAIDPGFRSGCKLVALDEFGNVLGHTLIHVIGAAERVQQSRARLAEQIKTQGITVVAIGNGTACRETEQLVASVLAEELAGQDVHYLIVNEAGASVYSTSQIGREELPRYDATVRGAVSIGRRALDPLSELVKIDPASIGVGLYQHDVKAKHLRTSLDAVVESCVNYVGVDVNSASPALLGYVSGLNQLTARRVYEYRQKHGPFRRREQLKDVPGVGEATYVQAAGFLKIADSENPLDETWIHPESYETASRVLAEIGCDAKQLVDLLKAKRTARAHTPGAQPTAAAVTNESPGAEVAECPAGPEAVSTVAVAIGDAPSEADPAAGDLMSDPAASVIPSPSGSAPAESGTAVSSPVDLSTAEAPTAESSTAEASTAEAPTAESVDVESTATAAGVSFASSAGASSAAASLLSKLDSIDVAKFAADLNVGELLLRDIMAALARPGRDPREDLSPPVFRREILKLENLKPGMELSGTVLNVVDFGAFVDIGLSDSGLIHVSRMADRFVSDPHEVVSVGDILNCWVVEVDEKRRRVSLTAIEPGKEADRSSPRQPRGAEGDRKSSQRRPKPRREPSGGGQAAGVGATGGAPPGASSTGGGQGRGRGGRPARQGAGEFTASGGAGGGRGAKSGGRPTGPWKPRDKPKPKPVVPITDAMADGREPMRTFSDLQQFFSRKTDRGGKSTDRGGKSPGKGEASE